MHGRSSDPGAMALSRKQAATTLCALALGLAAAGCSCGADATPAAPDSGAHTVDGGGVLAPLDAGDVFALVDAGPGEGTLLPIACHEIERTTTILPPLEPGQIVLRGHEDQLLLIERPNDAGTGGATTLFRFYVATLGEPFALLAEHEHERAVGMVLEARWREGGWDVIFDLFSHEGLVAWLRLEADGALDVREIRGPVDRRIQEIEVRSAGEDFVVLGREDEDSAEGPPWIAVLSPDGSHEWLDLSPPPGGERRWQVLPRWEDGEVLVLAARSDGRPPARVARVALEPLVAPDAWVDVAGPYAATERAHPVLHDTAGGLVLTEFVGALGAPARLRVQWWDEALRVTASWSIETVVRGEVSVVGAPPAQEIFLTLPDDDVHGLATVFHARVAEPGAVSTPAPIGRARASWPPAVVVDAEGRAQVVHFDDRVDVERVCPVDAAGER